MKSRFKKISPQERKRLRELELVESLLKKTHAERFLWLKKSEERLKGLGLRL